MFLIVTMSLFPSQIQIWSMHTCILLQEPMGSLLLLLVRLLPLLAHLTQTTSPRPHRATRCDQLFRFYLQDNSPWKYSRTMITLNVVAVLCRTWSLRPRPCPPCPRLPPQTVWVTWATSRTVCRAWFPHCRDRTLTCPPNNPTCPASSPCINRSAIMLTSLQASGEPLCFFTCFNILLHFCFLLGAPSWWPSATAAAPATAAGSSGSSWQRRGTAHLLRLIAAIPQAPDTLHPLPSSVLALTLSGLWRSPPETHKHTHTHLPPSCCDVVAM